MIIQICATTQLIKVKLRFGDRKSVGISKQSPPRRAKGELSFHQHVRSNLITRAQVKSLKLCITFSSLLQSKNSAPLMRLSSYRAMSVPEAQWPISYYYAAFG